MRTRCIQSNRENAGQGRWSRCFISYYPSDCPQPFKWILKSDNADDWKAPIFDGNDTSMAENYYLLFKPLPVGDHTIELEVIRQPLQANQPIEHDVAKWNIKVT